MKTYDVIVIAGTSEAHEAIEVLSSYPVKIAATVATDLGKDVLLDLEKAGIDIFVGRKTKEEFIQMFNETKVSLVIDASHPFAVEVSKTVIDACQETSVKPAYLRYVRPSEAYDYDKIIYVKDANEAAKMLCKMKGNFLLTTGANTVDIYKIVISDFNDRGYVRVLDTKASIDRCEQYAISMDHVIAKNPPFSVKDNISCIEKYHIQTMVSKDSGQKGGLFEKIESAKSAGIPLILIARPEDVGGISTKDELKKVMDKLQNGEIDESGKIYDCRDK